MSTKELIEEAKEYLKKWAVTPASCRDECEKTILSALEAAESRIKKLEAVKRDADYRLYKDGDKWCCVRRGFIDLQESDAWFGDTPEEALRLAITQGQPEGEQK